MFYQLECLHSIVEKTEGQNICLELAPRLNTARLHPSKLIQITKVSFGSILSSANEANNLSKRDKKVRFWLQQHPRIA